MTRDFTYEALPMRVVFGAGAIDRLAAEVDGLGLKRLLVLSTPGQRLLAERVATLLGRAAIDIFDGARMHVPVEVVDAATKAATGADGCVAIGGGSTIGLGKILALDAGLPFVAIPTTYAGSEMTTIWGRTENSRKETGRDRKVLPRSVMYDPELTVRLPAEVSATSGLNAMAHAMEALYAPDRSPITSLMAEEGARSLASALAAVVADGSDLDPRAEALRGAWLCGACLGATTMGLHHKLCHVLGGTFDLPHAATHAVVLPHVAAFMLANEPEARAALQRALGTSTPAQGFSELAERLGAPRSLAELGLTERDLDTVVEQVVGNEYSGRSVTDAALRSLLLGALHGDDVGH
jgi:maleylacetate reductase